MIIDKYEQHPDYINQNKLIPILRNQKMNAYLKEITAVCEIEKELTFQIDRYTFATIVTLKKAIPVEIKILINKTYKIQSVIANAS